MEIILDVMKCAICYELLESPVILPCSCSICNKHVQNQTNNVIRCEICRVEHQIPSDGFHANKALKVLIEAEIAKLDFGSVYKSAKKSCESVEETLNEFKVLLRDPSFYTHEKISELKNAVQLKGEELKLKIDEEMKKLIDRLDEFERQSKVYLSTNEFKEESKKFEDELKTTQSNLDSWLESLNKIKIDEEKWKSIKEESDQKLKSLTEDSDKFKNKLLLNNFDENHKHVKWFKSKKYDSIFEWLYWDFLKSKIINESSAEKLEELLKKRELNGRKWSLLYRGTRDGFKASDFHSHCDNKPNTLTIIQSTSGNIFGGFTSAQWDLSSSWKFDKSAFIYSLVNKENRPLLFEHPSTDRDSLCSHPYYGPMFGRGTDLIICSNLKTNEWTMNGYSMLGKTYTHPEYPYCSETARTILAGSHSFQVQEIEIFQMQTIVQ